MMPIPVGTCSQLQQSHFDYDQVLVYTGRGCAVDTVCCGPAEGNLKIANASYAKALEILDSDQISAESDAVIVRHIRAAVLANLACLFLRLGLLGNVIQVCGTCLCWGPLLCTTATLIGSVGHSSVVLFSAAQRPVSQPDRCSRLEAIAPRQPPAHALRWGPQSLSGFGRYGQAALGTELPLHLQGSMTKITCFSRKACSGDARHTSALGA